MSNAVQSNSSLWWKLSWQLSLVIIAVVTAVVTGLSVWAATILSPNIGAEGKIGSVLALSATRDPQGKFQLRNTPELKMLKEQNSMLWFVAATTDGTSISYGAVPPAYVEIAHLVHLFDDADIRGATITNEIASIDSVDTEVGQVRFLFGGVLGKGSPTLAILARSYPIYLPLIAMALPAIFFAVPRIVTNALAKVREVARKASEIGPRQHETRLPVDGIPKEVAPLVIAFNGALERLDNESRKRQRFFIDAAHELRTPIAIMMTRIDGMLEGKERERLLNDVVRLAETAEQLLDFERNNQTIDLHANVDLVEIVKTAVADIAPLAIAGGYQLTFQNEVNTVKRRGNPSALSRAVINLVRNAIDHGGNTGMITVSVTANGEIRVSDEGPGIPIEHQDLIFEPFYRVTPKSKGAGLGLSLVKQVVSHHEGNIAVESDSTGTSVTIQWE